MRDETHPLVQTIIVDGTHIPTHAGDIDRTPHVCGCNRWAGH